MESIVFSCRDRLSGAKLCPGSGTEFKDLATSLVVFTHEANKVGSIFKYGSNLIVKEKSHIRKFRFSGTGSLFFHQITDVEWIPAECEGNLYKPLQKPDRQEQSPCRCILRKPKYTLTMHVELRNIAQSTSGVSDIKKCMGILKRINIVNFPASINAMLKLQINVNLPQLLCCRFCGSKWRILSDLVGFNVNEHWQNPPNRSNSPYKAAETTIKNK